MSKNISIKEGGTGRQFTAKKTPNKFSRRWRKKNQIDYTNT